MLAAKPGMFASLASDDATRRYSDRQHYVIIDLLSSELDAPIVLAVLLLPMDVVHLLAG